VDIVRDCGQPNKAFKLSTLVYVYDGGLSIRFQQSGPPVNVPKISGLQVRQTLLPQSAAMPMFLAIVGGPYSVRDTDGDGFGLVPVDGSRSYTRGANSTIVSWTWLIDPNRRIKVGQGERTILTLPVGKHDLILEVKDSQGTLKRDQTVAVVKGMFEEWLAAYAMTGGPYVVSDTDGDGMAEVSVDGSRSYVRNRDNSVYCGSIYYHTWTIGDTVVGEGARATFALPVGQHNLTLRVADSEFSIGVNSTTVTVLPR
jgi:hypothetical protein